MYYILCSDVKSGSDITRSMIRDTPIANKIFSVPVSRFQKLRHVAEAFLISFLISLDYPTNFNAEASKCKKTVSETSLLESNNISRNPLIGNNFVAIKNSVVRCVPLAEVDLADKILLLDY